MQIFGISLQLVAGILLGLERLVPKSYFDKADQYLKRLSLLPYSNRRYRLIFSFVGALLAPTVFVVIIGFLYSNDLDTMELAQAAGGSMIFSLLVAYPYLLFVGKLSSFVTKNKQAVKLTGEERFRDLLVSNAILLPICTGLSVSGFYGLNWILPTLISIGYVRLWVFILQGINVAALTTAIFSFGFIFMSGVLKLVAMMSQASKQPFWALVLSLYVFGGLLLIVNSL